MVTSSKSQRMSNNRLFSASASASAASSFASSFSGSASSSFSAATSGILTPTPAPPAFGDTPPPALDNPRPLNFNNNNNQRPNIFNSNRPNKPNKNKPIPPIAQDYDIPQDPPPDMYEYNSPNKDKNNLNNRKKPKDPLDELAQNIPGGGKPNQDYPVFANPPLTPFSCSEQEFPGYYGDIDSGCQAFHVCQDRFNGQIQQDTFLCPNGTLFNQQYLVCDWWYNVDCGGTPDKFETNALLFQGPEVGFGDKL